MSLTGRRQQEGKLPTIESLLSREHIYKALLETLLVIGSRKAWFTHGLIGWTAKPDPQAGPGAASGDG